MMRVSTLKYLLCLSILLGQIACSNLAADYVTPKVSLKSFTPIKMDSLSPQFEVQLHVMNPNDSSLSLQGIAYTIEIEGTKLVTGVANNIPSIAAYGEGDITLNATVSLLGGFRVFSDLIRNQSNSINYSFEAKLDPGGIRPDFRVRESGEFSLLGE